ncbi:MAG: hypothetical protein KDA87_07495, partial [Planctomycetales bacterium]|nr:hypothetical protein [Planctomycetales bacterium]
NPVGRCLVCCWSLVRASLYRMRFDKERLDFQTQLSLFLFRFFLAKVCFDAYSLSNVHASACQCWRILSQMAVRTRKLGRNGRKKVIRNGMAFDSNAGNASNLCTQRLGFKHWADNS